jgi:hypothetical protein
MVGCVFDGVDLHALYSARLVFRFVLYTDSSLVELYIPFMVFQSMYFPRPFANTNPTPATAVLFVMTAYKGIYSLRGEQRSGIIQLLVRE